MLLLLGEGELSNEQQKVCKCKKKRLNIPKINRPAIHQIKNCNGGFSFSTLLAFIRISKWVILQYDVRKFFDAIGGFVFHKTYTCSTDTIGYWHQVASKPIRNTMPLMVIHYSNDIIRTQTNTNRTNRKSFENILVSYRLNQNRKLGVYNWGKSVSFSVIDVLSIIGGSGLARLSVVTPFGEPNTPNDKCRWGSYHAICKQRR